MSFRDEKVLSLLGTNLDELSDEELKKLCHKILKSKIHGICFSLYEGSQQPGDIVSDNQIIRRLEILKPYKLYGIIIVLLKKLISHVDIIAYSFS